MKIVDVLLRILQAIESVGIDLKELNRNFAEYKRNLNQVQKR